VAWDCINTVKQKRYNTRQRTSNFFPFLPPPTTIYIGTICTRRVPLQGHGTDTDGAQHHKQVSTSKHVIRADFICRMILWAKVSIQINYYIYWLLLEIREYRYTSGWRECVIPRFGRFHFWSCNPREANWAAQERVTPQLGGFPLALGSPTRECRFGSKGRVAPQLGGLPPCSRGPERPIGLHESVWPPDWGGSLSLSGHLL